MKQFNFSFYTLDGKQTFKDFNFYQPNFTYFNLLLLHVFEIPLETTITHIEINKEHKITKKQKPLTDVDIDTLVKPLTDHVYKEVYGNTLTLPINTKDYILLYTFFSHLQAGEWDYYWCPDTYFTLSFYKKENNLCIIPNSFGQSLILSQSSIKENNIMSLNTLDIRIYERDLHPDFKFQSLEEKETFSIPNEDLKYEIGKTIFIGEDNFDLHKDEKGNYVLVPCLPRRLQEYLYKKYKIMEVLLDTKDKTTLDEDTLHKYKKIQEYVTFMLDVLVITEDTLT